MNENARNCMCRLLASDDRRLLSLLLFDADAMVKVDFAVRCRDRIWFVSISVILPAIIFQTPHFPPFTKQLAISEPAMGG